MVIDKNSSYIETFRSLDIGGDYNLNPSAWLSSL